MTDDELAMLFRSFAATANTAIDQLIAVRQASVNGRKQRLGYCTKKLEIIVGACNRAIRAIDKLESGV